MRRRKSFPTPLFVALIVAGGLLVAGGVALAVYVGARGAKVVAEEMTVITTSAELQRCASREAITVRGKVRFANILQNPAEPPSDVVSPVGALLLSDGTNVSCLFADVRRDEFEAWRRAPPGALVTIKANVAAGTQLYNCRIVSGGR